MQKIKLREASDSKGRIVAKAKGAAVGTPATPVAFPVTAQLVNRDSGVLAIVVHVVQAQRGWKDPRRHQMTRA